MTNVQVIFLGLLQGITEFFPISSSGHLVLAEKVFGLHLDPQALLALNVLLHAGTLCALLLVYRSKWIALATCMFTGNTADKKLLLLIVLATLPAVVIGGLGGDAVTGVFFSSFAIGISFFCTAIFLWLGEQYGRKQSSGHISWLAAISIGFAQAVALVPGISRSGSTISVARLFGLNRAQAMDFSFLMAVPALCGAVVLTLISFAKNTVVLPSLQVLLLGFAVSFVTSIFAILFLRRFVQRSSLAWFSIYLLIIACYLVFLE